MCFWFVLCDFSCVFKGFHVEPEFRYTIGQSLPRTANNLRDPLYWVRWRLRLRAAKPALFLTCNINIPRRAGKGSNSSLDGRNDRKPAATAATAQVSPLSLSLCLSLSLSLSLSQFVVIPDSLYHRSTGMGTSSSDMQDMQETLPPTNLSIFVPPPLYWHLFPAKVT